MPPTTSEFNPDVSSASSSPKWLPNASQHQTLFGVIKNHGVFLLFFWYWIVLDSIRNSIVLDGIGWYWIILDYWESLKAVRVVVAVAWQRPFYIFKKHPPPLKIIFKASKPQKTHGGWVVGWVGVSRSQEGGGGRGGWVGCDRCFKTNANCNLLQQSVPRTINAVLRFQ